MTADLDGLQRTVFRMRLDPGFARDVLAAAPLAVASTGLGPRELAWLRAADPVAFRAEPRRREQVLGNLVAEMALTAALAPEGLIDGFLGSQAMHQAIATDAPLPLAFADWVVERIAGFAAPIARLEAEMVRARRLRRPVRAAALSLAPGVRLVDLPAGLLSFASDLRAFLDGAGPEPATAPWSGSARVVVAPRHAGPWALAELHVEELSGAVLDLVERAAAGMHPGDLARFALDWDATAEEADALVDALVGDGVLDRPTATS